MKVYLLMKHVPYEFDDVIDVYADQGMADTEAQKLNAGRSPAWTDITFEVTEFEVIPVPTSEEQKLQADHGIYS